MNPASLRLKHPDTVPVPWRRIGAEVRHPVQVDGRCGIVRVALQTRFEGRRGIIPVLAAVCVEACVKVFERWRRECRLIFSRVESSLMPAFAAN